jgi:uncharacterized MnhB-related membrane protein
MSLGLALALLAVAFAGTAVAFTRDPLRCAVVFGAFGTSLTLAFFIMKAPDVALSELTVGTVLVPVITLIAIAKTTRAQR